MQMQNTEVRCDLEENLPEQIRKRSFLSILDVYVLTLHQKSPVPKCFPVRSRAKTLPRSETT